MQFLMIIHIQTNVSSKQAALYEDSENKGESEK